MTGWGADADITGLHPSNRQASVAYHIISQPEWASLVLCWSECLWVSGGLLSPCLALPATLVPSGRAAHFGKRMGYGKMAEIKGSARRVCNELFMSPFGASWAWCFTAGCVSELRNICTHSEAAPDCCKCGFRSGCKFYFPFCLNDYHKVFQVWLIFDFPKVWFLPQFMRQQLWV